MMMGRRIALGLSWLCLLIAIVVLVKPNGSAEAGDGVFWKEDFENGWNGWWTDAGVWEIGLSPVGGPPGAPDPNNCAGTNLSGNYPRNTDSRLISPVITLPDVEGGERLQLRFWMRYSYSDGDYGRIQVSTNGGTTWSAYLATPALHRTSSSWSRVCVDLTGYKGQRVWVGFYHTADNYSDVSSGWYIDEVEVWCGVPSVRLPEGFENGWGDWCTDHGVWQIGIPTAGPPDGPPETPVPNSSAGTNLSGNYPRNTDSRLISPPISLPVVGADGIVQLCFWQWYCYNDADNGHVQVSTWNGSNWSGWETKATPANENRCSDWAPVCVNLTEYEGQQIRIAFYHTADDYNDISYGWYIDEVEIVPPLECILVAPPDDQTGCPGETLTYLFEIANNQNQDDTVDLAATSEHGWPISGVPGSAPIPSGGKVTVSVQLTIPKDAAGVTDRLTLTETSQTPDTECEPASASVTTTVPPIVELTQDQSDKQSGKPGQTLTYAFMVCNCDEQKQDTFDLAVTSEHGWPIPGVLDSVTVAPGDWATVLVNITIPGGAEMPRAGVTDVLTLTATSQNDPDIHDSASVWTTVLQVPCVDVEPVNAAGVGDLGDDVYFFFEVRNCGNDADRFNMAVTSEHDWPIGYPDGQLVPPIELPPLDRDAPPYVFRFYVTIPADAVAEEDLLTLTATSQSDNSVSDAAEVTCIVKPPRKCRIELDPYPPEIRYYEPVTLKGTFLAETTPKTNEYEKTPGETVRVVFTHTSGPEVSVTSQETSALGRFEAIADLPLIGIWSVVVRFDGDFDLDPPIAPCNMGYFPPLPTIEVKRDAGYLTLHVGSRRLRVGQSTYLWGTLSTRQVGLRIPDAPITLKVWDPDGQQVVPDVTTQTNEQGQYSFVNFPSDFEHLNLNPLPFSREGEWILQASFESDKLESGQSNPVSIDVALSNGYAIIITGKDKKGEGLEDHSFSTNSIYRTFIARGIPKESIRYLNFDTDQSDNCDPTENNDPIEVYGRATRDNIKEAIQVWGKGKVEASRGPLYIVATDHGTFGDPDKGTPAGLMLEKEVLRADELADWLNRFDEDLQVEPVPVVVIYGACFSGGFIPYLSSPGRIIITSAAEDEQSYKGPYDPVCPNVRGGEFFLSEFFRRIRDGATILESFQLATKATEAFTVVENEGGESKNVSKFLDTAYQHPLLDDDGDGRGSNSVSGLIKSIVGSTRNAAEVSNDGLNSNFVIGEGEPPPMAEIVAVTGDRFLNSGTEVSFYHYRRDEVAEQYLWAKVDDAAFDGHAFIEIKPPLSIPLASKNETMQLERDVYVFELRPGGDSTYIWDDFNSQDLNGRSFDGFDEPGVYEIAYYLQDAESGRLTTPVMSRVYRDRDGNYPPRPFSLEKPLDGATRVLRSPVFDWEDTFDPDEEAGVSPMTYTLIVTPMPGSPPEAKEIVVSGIDASAYGFDIAPDAISPLSDLTTYKWNVIAIDGYGARKWCDEAFSFTTDEPNLNFGHLRIKRVERTSGVDAKKYIVPRCQLKIVGYWKGWLKDDEDPSKPLEDEDGSSPRNDQTASTPLFVIMLPVGIYTIKLGAPGYEEYHTDVSIGSLAITELTIELKSIEVTGLLKAYMCVERFNLALKGEGRDKVQIRGLVNARRPEMGKAGDELFDLANDDLLIEVDDFQAVIPPGRLKESAPGSGRYAYKDKANGISVKLNLYGGMNSSRGDFRISIVSSLKGKVSDEGPISVRLENGAFKHASTFRPERKGGKARFTLGKTGELIQPGLCINRVSISGNSKRGDPFSSSKFSISGAFATGGENALAMPNDIQLQVAEGGFNNMVKRGDLREKKGRYTFKGKREGITSLSIDSKTGAFRISGSNAEMANVVGDPENTTGGNPVELILGIGDYQGSANIDERQTNVDMVKAGKRLVY